MQVGQLIGGAATEMLFCTNALQQWQVSVISLENVWDRACQFFYYKCLKINIRGSLLTFLCVYASKHEHEFEWISSVNIYRN